MALDIMHTDGDGADDVEGIAKAASNDGIISCGRCWEWTADDCEIFGWLEKGELFDKIGVTNVDQSGEQRACFGHCGGEPSSLVWIGGVDMGEAVKIGFRCSTDDKIAKGWGRDCSGSSGHRC